MSHEADVRAFLSGRRARLTPERAGLPAYGGNRRVKGLPTPRPLTHDLIVQSIELLGGEIQDIIINDLRDQTYFAKLRVRQEGELIEVDCRPSDAVAVAVTAKVPIYVNESVLGDALDED